VGFHRTGRQFVRLNDFDDDPLEPRAAAADRRSVSPRRTYGSSHERRLGGQFGAGSESA
jgi:hypothetical protein